MENNYFVSVIVPIYKVLAYLQEAIHSTINQEYRNVEIILVDDGSPDKCPEICDEYILKDERIITIHKMNGGLSDSRNYGLELAYGDYIAFLDSDDYFAPTMISRLVETAAEKRADIVVCNIDEIDEAGNRTKLSSYYRLNDATYSRDGALIELTGNKERTMTVTWNKLYKKTLWDGIRFPVGKIHEDVFTTYKLLNASNLVATVQDSLYIHRIRPGSIMTTRKANSYQCAIEALMNLLGFFVDKEIKQAIINTDLNCFEAIKSAYWNGYYDTPEIKHLVSEFRKKYGRAANRSALVRFRMNLFWRCPVAERIFYLAYRKVASLWEKS